MAEGLGKSVVGVRQRALRIRDQPELMLEEQSAARAMIGAAAALKRWEQLDEAVDILITQQREFVGWWQETVRRNRRPKSNVGLELVNLSVTQATERTGISQPQVSQWNTALKNTEKYREDQILAARRKAALEAEANHRAEGTGENEWFTPTEYIEAAREVLGEIDVDPATHPKAQETIGARRFFTRAEDGLAQEWHGRVWLNPPYARGEIGPFIKKLIEEIDAGRVTSSIVLTHSYTDTEWFHNAVSYSCALCFTRGRIKFINDNDETCAPTQGQTFFYFGKEVELFVRVFSVFGFVTYSWWRG